MREVGSGHGVDELMLSQFEGVTDSNPYQIGGGRYTSEVYRQALKRLQAVPNMRGKGECWDNAVQESFFSTLKTELDLLQARGSRAQTRNEVLEWIEMF